MTAYPGNGGLGQRLRIERARRQVTQAEAAKASGISLHTWQRAEHESRMPRNAVILGKLAAYLGCDPSDLIAGGSSVAGDATQADEPVVATASHEVRDGR